MASIEKAAGGWRVRVRKAGVSASGTFPTKAKALAWAAEHETEAAKIQHGGLPKKTVADAFRRYHDEVSPTKKGCRWEQIRLKLLESKWEISDKLLTDVTTPDVAALRDKRAKVVSASSVAREMSIIKKMFSLALREWKWLNVNPALDAKSPPEPEPRTRRVPQCDIDQILISAGYDDSAAVASPMAEMVVSFLFAIETAMRSGEILAITRRTYHRDRAVVHVPKSKMGPARDVPLSRRAIELLDKLPGKTRLFSISDESRDVLWRKVRDRTTIEDLHFHDTRREGTSRLAKKLDVLTLARVTGHKDLNMLLIYYQTDMQEVAKLLD